MSYVIEINAWNEALPLATDERFSEYETITRYNPLIEGEEIVAYIEGGVAHIIGDVSALSMKSVKALMANREYEQPTVEKTITTVWEGDLPAWDDERFEQYDDLVIRQIEGYDHDLGTIVAFIQNGICVILGNEGVVHMTNT